MQYVLVHGAWLGGWIWRRVLPQLHAAGHTTQVVTLTGVGERSHLLSREITLETHLWDVLNLIRTEEVSECVLVGHSYGGLVITGVADRLLQQGYTGLKRLVYVDAVVPLPGESWASQHDPKVVAQRLASSALSGGVSFPVPDSAVFGLEGEDREWANRRQTPHPSAVYQATLDFDAAAIQTVPRTFIDCTAPALKTIDVMRKRVREEPGWQIEELETGHMPMLSEPEEFSRILLNCAR